jgi:peptidoglycan/LPS O-acetylase OafA/YrhL
MDVKKFDQIDGLRFFAVFGVVCGHWHWSHTEFCESITSASRGVDLFFVISGFLITLGLIRSKDKAQSTGQSLYKFYMRRFLRIFPIYYLTVFILLFFYWNEMHSTIWWYLLYLRNFYSIKIQDWGIAGHFWSLSVEEQFYMVWPFVILFTPKKRMLAVIIASVLLSLATKTYWFFTHAPFWYAYMHPLGALDTLALGALLAYLYTFHQDWLRRVLYDIRFTVLIIVQMVICMKLINVQQFSFIHHIGIRTSFGIFSMWLIGRAAFGFSGVPGFILSSPPLRYVGKISYAIYLFHIFIPGMLLGLAYPHNEDLRFLMYSAVTIGAASLSWYLFESPILKLKSRFE